jgi:hypothetical protein
MEARNYPLTRFSSGEMRGIGGKNGWSWIFIIEQASFLRPVRDLKLISWSLPHFAAFTEA